MTCMKCKSDRILQVSAKCSDMCFVALKGDEKDGYVPDGAGIGGGDYIELKLCLNCGQVQDTFPKAFTLAEDEEEVLED